MPLSLLYHSALALFAQRTRIPTSARSIGFCAIWVCISSSSSSNRLNVILSKSKGSRTGSRQLEFQCPGAVWDLGLRRETIFAALLFLSTC